MEQEPTGSSAVRNEMSGGTVYGGSVQAHSVGSVNFRQEAVPALMPGVPAARTLPTPTPHFTDRAAVFDELTAALDQPRDAPAVVAFVGPGGIGKTATALKWAATLESRYPDGHLHVNLRGASAATAATPSPVLLRFLHALGANPAWVPSDQDGQADVFRTLTADRRLLVVLDDAHSYAQIRPLLTASPDSLTIITSRHRLGPLVLRHAARLVRLGPLGDRDALRLLTRVAGADRVAADRDGARSVARHCGGYPLALCATGARAAVRDQLSWTGIERELSEWQRTAGVVATNRDDSADGAGGCATEVVMDLSYNDLSPQAAGLYRLLGLRPWPSIPLAAAAAAAGTTEREAARSLEELAEVHLLEEVAEQRYRFHDVIRQHAERQARRHESLAASAASVRRVLTWYLRWAAAADACVLPGRWHLGPAYDRLAGQRPAYPDGCQALAALREERESLVEAVTAAEEYGFDELVWQLCEAMWGLHLRLGFHQDWVRTHRAGLAAAVRCADGPAEGRMRSQLAFALMALGDHEEAEEQLRAAVEADRAAGHVRGQATAVESLGLLRLEQRRYDDAAELLTTAADLAREAGDPRAVALLEHHLGRAMRGQRRYPEAVRQLERARELLRALPDPYNEARVLTSAGETWLEAGEPARAADALARASAVMEQEGAVIQQARIAELRAQCARGSGDAGAELGFLRTALRLHEETGAPAAAQVRQRIAELVAGRR